MASTRRYSTFASTCPPFAALSSSQLVVLRNGLAAPLEKVVDSYRGNMMKEGQTPMLVLSLQHPAVPNLDLIDTPGLEGNEALRAIRKER